MDVYPLLFDPIFKPKIWGGRRLETELGKTLPPSKLIGESWELADLPNNESVVRFGPCEGRTLNDILQDWGRDLIGDVDPAGARFPLLIKFLDAHQDLSVQVHPTAEIAAAQPDAYLKNEAWYVLASEDDGSIYYGLNEGVTRDAFIGAINTGAVESTLRKVAVQPGECYYLPSGTVHALGAGVLVAEVQTPSDTTYRLFDWNRIDESTGRPRELHIEQAIRCIDFANAAPPIDPHGRPLPDAPGAQRMAACQQFVIDKHNAAAKTQRELPTGRMRVWMVLDGSLTIRYADTAELLVRRGDTMLLPAALTNATIIVREAGTWLDITIPE